MSVAAAGLLMLMLCKTDTPSLDRHVSRTFLFAIHLSLLIVFPTVDALGIPDLYQGGTAERYRWTRLFCSLE